MFEATTRRARRIAAVTAAGALVATGFVLPVINAVDTSADTLSADVATVTAVATTPAFAGQGTNGLVAGQSISIRADRVGTNNINSIEVRLCKSGANIAMDSDFNPSQGGKCINAPFAGSTNNDSVLADGVPGAIPATAANEPWNFCATTLKNLAEQQQLNQRHRTLAVYQEGQVRPLNLNQQLLASQSECELSDRP